MKRKQPIQRARVLEEVGMEGAGTMERPCTSKSELCGSHMSMPISLAIISALHAEGSSSQTAVLETIQYVINS